MMDKDELEGASERWKAAAEINGYRCAVCSTIPPYEEREIYFDTKLCGWCAHMAAKDD